MNLNSFDKKKVLIVLPAITALLLALIPTLKYQWPLGWDIIYHVQYAQVYATNGFTLTDSLLNAPHGQQMGYPPLFHFLIAGLGTLSGVDFFQVARLLQPVMATLMVLSVSYVAYKFYGEIAGLGAGFLMLSSYLLGRMILPLPENLALIFIPLAVYLYFTSIRQKDIKPAILGGVLFTLVVLTHQPATLCLFLVIIGITVIELVIYRKLNILKNLLSFFAVLIGLMIIGVVALQAIAPQILMGISGQLILVAIKSSTLIVNRPLSLWGYFGNLGVLVTIFSVIGGIIALKKRREKDLVILVWVFVMILLSNAYWFGINVISYRVVMYLLIPLSILGGLGLTCIIQRLKTYQNDLEEDSPKKVNPKKYPFISSPKFVTVFLIVIVLLCAISGILTVNNPKVAIFGAKNQFETVQIAPPSDSEVSLANWFKENGNKSRSIIISNQFVGMFVATIAGMPMHYDFDYFSIKDLPLSIIQKEKIGYVVFDKRLVLSPQDNVFYLKKVDAEFYPLYYSSVDIDNYIDQIKPDSSHIVYENNDFIVFKMDY